MKSWFKKKMVELEFHMEFASTLDATVCISSFRNLNSTIDLEFLKLVMLVFQFVLQQDN